jgi:branched-chain amino acid aminotransferase
VVEKDLPLEVLAEAEDVVLTSSTRSVQPQAAVDDRPLPRGAQARAAQELFERRAAADLDP